MDWKERQRFEQGTQHGIAIAMLSAGLSELAIGKHDLWSYTHRLSIDRAADGSPTYRIVERDLPKRERK